MGMTKSDMNRAIYHKWLKQGMTHKEIVKRQPKRKREQFITDINKSAFESHYGVKYENAFPVLVILAIAVAFIIGKFAIG